jgi:hypothetical protein
MQRVPYGFLEEVEEEEEEEEEELGEAGSPTSILTCLGAYCTAIAQQEMR